MENRYTLTFDEKDPRDFFYSKKKSQWPDHVDLRHECSPVENQGRIGSCTANALVGQLEFLEKKSGGAFTDLSRLFVYYNERFVEKRVNMDSGATLRDGIKALKNFGVCPEKVWPYRDDLVLVKPDATAYAEAKGHKISVYQRLQSLDDMRDCLASGYPFVFGIKAFASIESEAVRKSGFIPLPKIDEPFLGGHALMAVGYDSDEKLFTVRNSWGKDWGQEGYGWLPFGYFHTGLAMDFWSIAL